MRTRYVLLASALMALLPAIAGAGYVIVLKGGKTIPAREAPTYVKGQARYYTPSGTFTAMAETLVDREATTAANTADAAPRKPAEEKRTGAAAVKLGDAKSKLRRLEGSAATSVTGAASPTAPAGAETPAAPEGAAPESEGDSEETRLLESERERTEEKMKALQDEQKAQDAKREAERNRRNHQPVGETTP